MRIARSRVSNVQYHVPEQLRLQSHTVTLERWRAIVLIDDRRRQRRRWRIGLEDRQCHRRRKWIRKCERRCRRPHQYVQRRKRRSGQQLNKWLARAPLMRDPVAAAQYKTLRVRQLPCKSEFRDRK